MLALIPAARRISGLGTRLDGNAVTLPNVVLAFRCKTMAVVGVRSALISACLDVGVESGARGVIRIVEYCALLGIGEALIVGFVFPLGGDNVAADEVMFVAVYITSAFDGDGRSGALLLLCFVG